MNHEIIEKIRDNIDLLELIKEYVPSVRKAGRTFKACCPFHQEKTPSFVINPDKGLFYCFGCQKGGDVFAFLMGVENLSFPEAARKLAERAGIDYQPSENLTDDEKARLKGYKLVNLAKDFFHKVLLSSQGEAARTYIKSRNINKETAVKFELGFATGDGLCQKAVQEGYTIDELKKFGLSNQYGKDYFRARLMFPIYNHRGEAVAFGGRIMGDGQPKYLNSPETPVFSKSRLLYGLNIAAPEIRKEGKVILLEGYMDVISCHQAGAQNCVAPLGTSFTPEHAKLLKRYTNEAAVCFDPDAAGIKAALRAALILVEGGIYVRVATLPEKLDPDEYIIKYGKEQFYKVINSASDIINFQLDLLLKNAANLNPQDKANIAAELAETIKKQPDEIIKNEWIKIAAERLSLTPDLILSKIGRAPSAQQAAPVRAAAKDKTPSAEADLAKWLLRYPRYVELCKDLTEDHFENKEIWTILKGIETVREKYPNQENIAQQLIETIPQEEDKILRLSLADLPEGSKPSVDIAAFVTAIKRAGLSKKLQQLKQQLKAYPVGQVPLDLLKRQAEIQKKLKS